MKLSVGPLVIAGIGLAMLLVATLVPDSSELWNWFDFERRFLAVIVVLFCGSVIYWIHRARSGGEIKVRPIAGLEAVDEAVGRATEMGRACLFVPGISDMNEVQTIAGMTILARVANTAARFDASLEVPTVELQPR